MINLIRAEKTADELAAVFVRSPVVPLLPPMGDVAWQEAAKKPLLSQLLSAMRSRAMAEVDQPMPVLTDELYADFHKTGNRLPFEREYFARRQILARAVMATLVESDPAVRDRLLRSALAKLQSVFDEVSWSLPAHVWDEPTGKNPMQIDLFAAESANLFGELLQLLGPAIPAELQIRIRQRLYTQFFENYLNKEFGWASFTHNWNAVCHQGVLGAALSVCDDPKLLGRLFHRAAGGLAKFLSGFASDGGSSEGPGYWGYGFGWFTELNAQLERRTNGQLSVFDGDEHVHAIASFGPRMTLSNGFCVNFSDNSARSVPRPSVLQYLGERFDDPFIRAHAAIAWKRIATTSPNLDEQRCDVFHLTRHLLRAPTTADMAATLPDGDTFLPALSVAITRFHDSEGHFWEFAGKGGHNAEHHNHNDVGSYLLNIDGQRMLTEIGAPEYNRAFFSAKRYESIAARSLGHPVPLINGVEQPPGGPFETPVLRNEASSERLLLSLDLTPAYPAEANCAKCVRTFEIDKPAGRLAITDEFELTKADAVESAVVTESPVTVAGGVATIAHDGITLRITPAKGTTLGELQTHPYNDHRGKPTQMYRIMLKPAAIGPRVTLGCMITIT